MSPNLSGGFALKPPAITVDEGRSQAVRYLELLIRRNIAHRPGTEFDEALLRLIVALHGLRLGRLTVDAFADEVATCVLLLLPAQTEETIGELQ